MLLQKAKSVKLLFIWFALCVGLALHSKLYAAPLVIRYSHVVADVTPKGQAAIKFKELVEKKLPGKVLVQVYPNSQLFGDDKEMQALLLGDVQIIAPSLSQFDQYTHQLQIFDLPFLFTDITAVERFQAGPHGQRLLASMSSKGIHGFGYLHNGMKQLSANVPLYRPQDAKGLAFRIQASGVLDTQFRTLGAKAKKIPFSEAYQAMKTGLVDGAENPWSNIYSQRFDEVQPYIMESNHGVLDYLVIGNAKWWSALPPDIQKTLSEAMAESIQFGNQVARNEEATFRNQVIARKRARVLALDAAQLQAWRTAMRPVWKKFEAAIGQDLIKAALQAN